MGRRSGALLLAVALVACAGDDDGGDGTAGASTVGVVEESTVGVVEESTTVTASELAPSQVTASTVARPDTPPPCEPADLAWWTAQVVHVGTSGTATLRVRNDGERWCEVDIGSSPGVSPEAEPNVWLEPGEWADLLVGSAGTGCPAEVVREVDLVLGGTAPIAVPTGVVVECGVTLLAFYVVDLAAGACASLTPAVTDDALLVRNDDVRSCELGELVAADGVGIGDASERSLVEIIELAGGDVVAFDLRSSTGADCPDETATIEFATAGELTVPGTGQCAFVVLGPGRPWFAGTGGPLRVVADGDIDGALAALVPFG